MNIDRKQLNAVSFISATLGRQFCADEDDSLYWESENWDDKEYFAVQLDCAVNEITIHEELPSPFFRAVAGWAHEFDFKLSQRAEETSPIKTRGEKTFRVVPEATFWKICKEMERREAEKKASNLKD